MANLIDGILEQIEPTVNERGNKVYRLFVGPNADRYHFDFKVCTVDQGWEQFDTDQDAWYFGVWVHVERRLTVTYAEGDLTVVSCPTLETFRFELKDAEEFYGAPPPMAIGIDEHGHVTEFYDERPTA